MLRTDLADIDARITRACNGINERVVGRTFAVISRLGDGIFWYALMLALPLATGRWRLGLAMAATGLAATWTYTSLKSGTRRLRPCERHPMPHLTVAPLDRFSFPSGHTLHAVCFTVMACTAYPRLAWLLVPFTVLVALSRLVLGLHYPSDVLVGGAIGGAIGLAGAVLFAI